MNYQILREINFVLLFITFLVLVYKGTLKLINPNTQLDWVNLTLLIWVIVLVESTGEVLYKDAVGGLRVFLTTFGVLFTLYVSIFHMKVNKK